MSEPERPLEEVDPNARFIKLGSRQLIPLDRVFAGGNQGAMDVVSDAVKAVLDSLALASDSLDRSLELGTLELSLTYDFRMDSLKVQTGVHAEKCEPEESF